MKKYDLFQITILGIGAWAAFQTFVVATSLIVYFVRLGIDGFRIDNTQKYIVSNFILGVAYYLLAYFALRKTEQVIDFLKPEMGKNISELGEDVPPAAEKPLITKADIMRMVLVGAGFILLIPAIPELLENLYYAFRYRLRPDMYAGATDLLLLSLGKTLLFICIIAFSRKITSLLKF